MESGGGLTGDLSKRLVLVAKSRRSVHSQRG